MALATEFVEIPLAELHREAAVMKAEGWRFIQTHAANGEDGVDLYYSFMKNGLARNLKIKGVKSNDAVPSITDLFLAAFVFENEARELFGVDMRDIALDFQGAMYAPAVDVPMTIITPEQKAAREKAAKAAAAKAAKESADDAEAAGDVEKPAGKAAGRRIFVMTPERRARLDAKLATMSPDKVAKVEAALKAREAEAAAAAAGAGQAVKKAPVADEAKPADAETETKMAETTASAPAPAKVDAELEKKLAHMDPAKAAKVRSALASGRARNASSKGGE